MKRKRRLLSSCIAAAVFSILTGALAIGKARGYILYLFGLTTDGMIVIGLLLMLAALLTALILALRGKRTLDKTMIWLAVCAALLIGGPHLLPNTSLKFPEYHLIASEDQRHTILVEEMGFLRWADGNYYEKVGRCRYRYVGRYSLDEHHFPFSENTYHIDWRDDGADVTVFVPATGETQVTGIQFSGTA